MGLKKVDGAYNHALTLNLKIENYQNRTSRM